MKYKVGDKVYDIKKNHAKHQELGVVTEIHATDDHEAHDGKYYYVRFATWTGHHTTKENYTRILVLSEMLPAKVVTLEDVL